MSWRRRVHTVNIDSLDTFDLSANKSLWFSCDLLTLNTLRTLFLYCLTSCSLKRTLFISVLVQTVHMLLSDSGAFYSVWHVVNETLHLLFHLVLLWVTETTWDPVRTTTTSCCSSWWSLLDGRWHVKQQVQVPQNSDFWGNHDLDNWGSSHTFTTNEAERVNWGGDFRAF